MNCDRTGLATTLAWLTLITALAGACGDDDKSDAGRAVDAGNGALDGGSPEAGTGLDGSRSNIDAEAGTVVRTPGQPQHLAQARSWPVVRSAEHEASPNCHQMAWGVAMLLCFGRSPVA
jgi:hypothetical protein